MCAVKRDSKIKREIRVWGYTVLLGIVMVLLGLLDHIMGTLCS